MPWGSVSNKRIQLEISFVQGVNFLPKHTKVMQVNRLLDTDTVPSYSITVYFQYSLRILNNFKCSCNHPPHCVISWQLYQTAVCKGKYGIFGAKIFSYL